MTSVLPDLTAQIAPYVFIAIVMVAANLYFLVRLFPRKGGTPNLATIILIFGLLFMSAGLWLALIYSITTPGDTSSIVVFIAGNSMMAVFGAWMLGVMLRAEERYPSPTGWVWPTLLALLFVGNEIMMGLVFVIAQTAAAPNGSGDGSGLIRLLTDSIVSIWFFWAMLANMVVLVLWLPVARAERRLLLLFAGSSAVSPWVLAAPLAAALAILAFMGATFVVLYREVGTAQAPPRQYLRVALAVGAAMLLMSVTAFVAFAGVLTPYAGAPFALASALIMGAEIALLARWAFRSAPPSPRDTVPGSAPSDGAANSPISPGPSP